MDATRQTTAQGRIGMKRPTLEQEIIASRPQNFAINEIFIDQTMRQISNIAGKAPIRSNKLPSVSIFKRITLLPTPVMVAIIVLGLCVTSGAAYAAYKYAPSLLNITSKKTGQRGTNEYTIANFEQCQAHGLQKVDRFELKKSAAIQSDNEIIKILQAKCELGIIDTFVKDKWPTQQISNKSGKENTIYARADVIAQYNSESNNMLTYVFNNETKQMTTPKGMKLHAYDHGKEVAFQDIPKGSTVFVVMQVKEQTKETGNPSSDVVGVLGIVKLGLPPEYYYEKQNLLTEVTKCIGNETELCPSTASIDVFPREPNSEGASNAYFNNQDVTYREISGTIQRLDASSMILRTSSDNQYMVTTPNKALERYNHEFAKNYTDTDASLKIGSNVSIRYAQPTNSNPKQIRPEDIQMISLLLDVLNTKDSNIKQY